MDWLCTNIDSCGCNLCSGRQLRTNLWFNLYFSKNNCICLWDRFNVPLQQINKVNWIISMILLHGWY